MGYSGLNGKLNKVHFRLESSAMNEPLCVMKRNEFGTWKLRLLKEWNLKKNTTNNNNLGKICLKLKNKIVYMYTHNISRTSQRLQENQAA